MKRFVASILIACAIAGAACMASVCVATGEEGALSKTFNYDYRTCWWKMQRILKAMPNVTIYKERYSTIGLYYINPNTTDVVVRFAEVDATHTRVDVTSESSSAKNWVADNLFSGAAKGEQSSLVDYHKQKPSKTRDW